MGSIVFPASWIILDWMKEQQKLYNFFAEKKIVGNNQFVCSQFQE